MRHTEDDPAVPDDECSECRESREVPGDDLKCSVRTANDLSWCPHEFGNEIG